MKMKMFRQDGTRILLPMKTLFGMLQRMNWMMQLGQHTNASTSTLEKTTHGRCKDIAVG
jgi:hypothetical protein